jgi:hypothetical protein
VSADPNWTPAMARRDAADQIDQWNADWRDEIASQRNEDRADMYDDRPTRAELERDDFDWENERWRGWTS